MPAVGVWAAEGKSPTSFREVAALNLHCYQLPPLRTTAGDAATGITSGLAARRALGPLLSDTVDTLDLGAFYARGGARNQHFRRAMMRNVVVFGYATGMFSSRRIERKLHGELAFRVLGAGNFTKTARSATSGRRT